MTEHTKARTVSRERGIKDQHTMAMLALDKLNVPRGESEDGESVTKVFTLAERIKEFWPYPVAVAWNGTVWVRADNGETWIAPNETHDYPTLGDEAQGDSDG